MAPNIRHLIKRSGQALGMSQVGLARAVGASGRSGQRWIAGGSRPRKAQLVALARLLQPVDHALAALVARQAGITIAESTVSQARVAADVIVCAAAESVDTSPRVARRVIAAALARARELGVELAELEKIISA